ncbi:hypothetical protein [Brasilonema bromeliae]|uniref:hypothetical protein n=1 Tax=Brasilonema bromeliae TaxID=383615 RepID=UPI00145DA2D3|nr:hypothetical protein [Brasilonema bromeliae]
MTSYIFFDDALQMLVNAFLASILLLMVISCLGLAVIETMEKTGIRLDTKRLH